MLVEGKWSSDWHPVQAADGEGRFVRQASSFRNWITPDGSAGPTGKGGFAAEKGRYHLYVALICPWASRVLIARKLKRLEDFISISIVEPFLGEQGWAFGEFDGATPDHLFGFSYLHQVYTRADPRYSGRATVPVLWDKKRNVLVNNESADILRMLNGAFENLAPESLNLYPPGYEEKIDRMNSWLYKTLNNGVYRAGFASSQFAYEEAAREVFASLDRLEDLLGDGRKYLFGNRLTETDIRLFVTLVRFDAVYHGLFKTNLRRIRDYFFLQEYLERLLEFPGIRQTVSLSHIMHGYYSIRALNPSSIVPLGPDYLEKMSGSDVQGEVT